MRTHRIKCSTHAHKELEVIKMKLYNCGAAVPLWYARCMWLSRMFVDKYLIWLFIYYKQKTFKNGFFRRAQGEFFFARTSFDPMYGRRKWDTKASRRKVGISLIYFCNYWLVWLFWSIDQTHQLKYGMSHTSHTSTGRWYVTAVSRVLLGTTEGCLAAVQMVLLQNMTCIVFHLWWVVITWITCDLFCVINLLCLSSSITKLWHLDHVGV